MHNQNMGEMKMNRYDKEDLVIFCLLTAVIVAGFLGMAWSVSNMNTCDRRCTALGGVYVSDKCLLIDSIDIE